MTTNRLYKKLKNLARVFYWFVIYNLANRESGKVRHLMAVFFRHLIRRTPYAVIIETSNTCNFKCPTCPTPHKLIHSRRPPLAMDFESYCRIIDRIKKYVHIVYLYNSNEPLLHPRLAEMIRYASDNDLHTMISTNSSLLTEDLSRKLLDSGLGEIRFALDGMDKETYERFRSGGDFETVIANIERFCRMKKEMGAKKPITTLQFILNKLNYNQVGRIKEFVRQNGIDRLYVKPLILSEYAYPPEDAKKLGDEFFADFLVDDDNVVYEKKDGGLVPKIEPVHCPAANNIFTVLADGRAVVCCFDLYGDMAYGDLAKDDFNQVWNSPQAKKVRQAAYRRQFPLCRICGNIE